MRFLLIILFTGLHSIGISQSGEKLSPYLLSEFQPGILYYQNKDPQNAELNYHKVGEEIVLKHRDLMIPLNELEVIDSVRIGEHIFVKLEEVYYECAIHSTIQLLIHHKASSQQATKSDPYGTKTTTGAVASLEKSNRTFDFYRLHWDSQMDIVDRTDYWILKEGVMHKANSVKQIGSIFPALKKEIKSYVSKHKLDLNQPTDVKELILFCMK